MTKKDAWSPVAPGDEYAEDGDTHYLDARDWSYYWNARRRVVRRYGTRGGYQEASYHHRPDPAESSLVGALGAIFSFRKKHGALLVDEAA